MVITNIPLPKFLLEKQDLIASILNIIKNQSGWEIKFGSELCIVEIGESKIVIKQNNTYTTLLDFFWQIGLSKW